jgi:hypothetical protein
MLLQICEFMQREKIASNQQIARAFQLDIAALEPMLAMCLRKGMLSYAAAPSSCQQRCTKCQLQSVVYYQYKLI